MNRIRVKVVDAVAPLTEKRCEYAVLYTRLLVDIFSLCNVMTGTTVSTGARCLGHVDSISCIPDHIQYVVAVCTALDEHNYISSNVKTL